MIPEAKLANLRVALAARDREIERLRRVLKALLDIPYPTPNCEYEDLMCDARIAAREALQAKGSK